MRYKVRLLFIFDETALLVLRERGIFADSQRYKFVINESYFFER